ncbi:hypothetical protein B0O80DRAFT_435176 [Mortierella sp. GBAus27b]|nr:hypothetical protein B0O80DRAFT_435176 [Mortierella sp. GBAus27b]
MPLGNLLEIPELMELVRSHLDNRDLATCLRVSTGWHELFLPLLWHRIVLRMFPGCLSGSHKHVPVTG